MEYNVGRVNKTLTNVHSVLEEKIDFKIPLLVNVSKDTMIIIFQLKIVRPVLKIV